MCAGKKNYHRLVMLPALLPRVVTAVEIYVDRATGCRHIVVMEPGGAVRSFTDSEPGSALREAHAHIQTLFAPPPRDARPESPPPSPPSPPSPPFARRAAAHASRCVCLTMQALGIVFFVLVGADLVKPNAGGAQP